jgi:GT2 family glycosyltransferase
VDFCRRAAHRGYRMFYVPQAVANHTGGHSLRRLPVESRHFYWYGSLLRYSAKHFGGFAFRAVCLAVVTGSFMRVVAESALRRSLKPMAAYRRVVWLAGRCLISGARL